MVKERLARLVALCDLAAARMTLRADLDLAIGCARLRAYRVAGRRVFSPRDAAPFIEARAQTVVVVSSMRFLPLWQRGGFVSGPFNVLGAGAVTGFAAYTDFGPACLEFIGGGIVIFADIG